MIEDNTASKPKIVVVGGGTGTSTVLAGLKKYPVSLGAVISTSDSGGSSGVLREEFDMVPPGDVRQCFVALNKERSTFLDFFNVRFTSGALRGHAFGNAFFALLAQDDRDFCSVVSKAEEMVGAEHSIFPATHQKTNLVAVLRDGTTVQEQHSIAQVEGLYHNLKALRVEANNTYVNKQAVEAIQQADVVVVGPGDLVSSVSPPLLLPEIREALRTTNAHTTFVVNLFNQRNIQGFTVEDYLRYIDTYIGDIALNSVLYNTEEVLPARLEKWGYKDEDVVRNSTQREHIRYIPLPLVDSWDVEPVAGDPIVRTPIRHSKERIGKALYELATK